MSGFYQLQTYLQTHAALLPQQLNEFSGVWKSLIGRDPDIEKYLGRITWEQDHSRCIIPHYAGGWKSYDHPSLPLSVRPLILLWVPDTQRHLSKFWLELSVLIDNQGWVSDEQQYFLPEALPSLRTITEVLHQKLQGHMGIFLTDENQDGHPWEGWLTTSPNLLWHMSAAWLISEMAPHYHPLHKDFTLNQSSWGIELLNQNYWNLGRGQVAG